MTGAHDVSIATDPFDGPEMVLLAVLEIVLADLIRRVVRVFGVPAVSGVLTDPFDNF